MLRLGSAATDTHQTGLRYETTPGLANRGIVDFFIFRKKPNNFWPAFDIAYNFLMAQEDVRINAAPSVTTLNQTPAQISLVEEISIDMGAAPIDTNQGIAFTPQFSRAQYGTTVVITPTIHDPEVSFHGGGCGKKIRPGLGGQGRCPNHPPWPLHEKNTNRRASSVV